MATLPPWLNIQPSQFVAAAESGARLGQAEKAQAMSFLRQQQDNQLAQQSQQLEAQKLAMAQRQQQTANQMSLMKMAIEKKQADARNELALASYASQAELRKQALLASGKSAALKAQQQNDYSRAFQQIKSSNPEISDNDAAMKASFTTGFSSPGLASMMKTAQPAGQEEPIYSPEGKFIGMRLGNTMKMVNAGRGAGAGGSSAINNAAYEKALLKVMQDEASGAAEPGSTERFKQLYSPSSAPSPDAAQGATERYKIVARNGRPVAAPEKPVPAPSVESNLTGAPSPEEAPPAAEIPSSQMEEDVPESQFSETLRRKGLVGVVKKAAGAAGNVYSESKLNARENLKQSIQNLKDVASGKRQVSNVAANIAALKEDVKKNIDVVFGPQKIEAGVPFFNPGENAQTDLDIISSLLFGDDAPAEPYYGPEDTKPSSVQYF
jgi:hypothetical protein